MIECTIHFFQHSHTFIFSRGDTPSIPSTIPCYNKNQKTMNWTGGRLHRHSTTNAPQHKHKGQAIRKPTQGPQQVTLFHKFKQTKAQDPDKHTPNDKDNQTSHQKQVSLHLWELAKVFNQYNVYYTVPYDLSIFITKPSILERIHSSREY